MSYTRVAHVSAAKAGVDALSNVVAVEEGPRGIRSNVIAPVCTHLSSYAILREKKRFISFFRSLNCRVQFEEPKAWTG